MSETLRMSFRISERGPTGVSRFWMEISELGLMVILSSFDNSSLLLATKF